MKRLFLTLIFLAVGFAFGGAAVFWYLRAYEPLPPQVKAVVKKQGRRIVFYRSPMNPKATSPSPRKDEMGMDYLPVYEEEAIGAEPEAGVVRISPEKIQKAGVKSEIVKRRQITRVIRTVGRVEPVENFVYNITTKIPGWVEKLYVSRTDQMVHQGDPLLELYSPDLVTAQEEYLLAYKSRAKVKDSPSAEVKRGSDALLEAAKKRLKYWDISDDQIKTLEDTGKTTRTMIIRAPAHGSVTEKMVVEGQKIETGEPLFRIIDHSSVWVYGEIYEYEIPYIKLGEKADLTTSYAPGEVYKGKIDHIYSHLGSIRYEQGKETEVRTVKVRFELANSGGKLKLGMYLNVEIAVTAAVSALSVPDSAVIDSGRTQIVIIDRKDGAFEPRKVTVGAKGNGYYEIRSGISAGEWVVTSANFLIDSESNLSAALGAMSKQGDGERKVEPRVDETPVKPAKMQGHMH
ncbi:MAG: efflux RND transporter periplasmic adaptor subunit [Deltaproteobacteria bacterium]|nr:efflux RND transporter periplasmic adaptor subunit [Deltaproteobacteria bacterium]